MICTQASFEDKEMANDARRELKRTNNLAVKVRYCELCDCYHFDLNLARQKMPKRAIEVLRLKGQGFNRREISKDLNISTFMVNHYETVLFRLFNANSSNHLIAIAIAVGALSPNDFVPEVTERNHDARSPGSARRVGGNLSPSRRRGVGADTRGVG